MNASVKKDFVQPIAVLVIICLVITALLAVTNHFTAPVIETGAAERAEAARREIIPDAGSFEELSTEGMPESIKGVYRADNGSGVIFMMTVTGYGGDMDLICGIDNDGRIISVKTLDHSETKGMGSKTTEEPFRSQFVGKDSSLEGVDGVSGATISSRAYLGAVRDAFTAWELVKEGT